MPLTLAQLENPTDLIANVAKTILLADSPAWPFPVYANRELGAMNVNRIEVTATGFRRASDHMGFDQNNTPYYDHRTGQLAFNVVTARTDQQTTDNHAYCVGRIGYLCSRTAQKFTTAAMSNLVVLDIVDLGTSATESEKTDTDRTLRTFEITYVIPPSVMNAAT